MTNLKHRARQIGLQQCALARTLGVSEPAVSRWLNRRRVIPSRYLQTMAFALQLPIEDLLPPRRRAIRRAA